MSTRQRIFRPVFWFLFIYFSYLNFILLRGQNKRRNPADEFLQKNIKNWIFLFSEFL